jgi:hypothetical protein
MGHFDRPDPFFTAWLDQHLAGIKPFEGTDQEALEGVFEAVEELPLDLSGGDLIAAADQAEAELDAALARIPPPPRPRRRPPKPTRRPPEPEPEPAVIYGVAQPTNGVVLRVA